MQAPAINPTVNDLIQEISALNDALSSEEFAIRRIERKVTTEFESKKVSPEAFYMLLGMLAALRGDRIAAEKAVDNSIALAPGNPTVLENGLTVYSSFGTVRKTIPLLHDICARFPDNKSILGHAVIKSFGVLQFSFCLELLNRLEKLRINDQLLQNSELAEALEYRGLVPGCLAAAKEHDFTDIDLADRLETAVAAVRANLFEVARTSSLILSDYSFVHQFHIRADHATCADINFHIAGALSERYADTGIELFSIVCRPLEDFTNLVPEIVTG
jgi:hypothetical protein